MEMGYDFAASEINEAAVRTQHRCEFLDGAQNRFRLEASSAAAARQKE